MSTEAEVRTFLNAFKQKMKVFDVFYRNDRGKNFQALADLEIRPIDRTRILEALEIIDYNQGPLEEALYNGADMWVFGTTVKAQEVYIKITMGPIGSSVICISFHKAERPMTYPFK